MWLNYGILFLFVFGIKGGKITKDDSCDMPDEEEWEHKDFLFSVDDVDTNSIKEYKIKNIIDLKINPTTYVKYSFEKEKSILRFSLTEDFQKFVEKEDNKLHTIKLTFTCKNLQTIEADLNLLVTTTKNYPPEFLNIPYNFKLILPIFANKIVEGVDVKALDLNLGNEKLVFSVTGDCSAYFEFIETTKNFKTYSTNLKSKQLIQLDQSLTCDIEVHDGTDNVKTQMILKVDTQNSQPPNPIFEKPLYEAKRLNDNTLEHEDIKLVKTDYTPKFLIDSEYKDYFKFENNKLSLLKSLPEDAFDKNKYLAVTIEATYEKAQFSGKTVVLITSSKENGKDDIPIFEEPLYLAQYVDSNTITHEDIKLKTTNTDVSFDIISDYKTYFIFENYQLTLTTPLPEEEFESTDFITVIIEAKYKDNTNTGKTVIIIKPPKKINIPNPVFEQPLYVVKYTDPNTIERPVIKLESTKYKATFKILSDYKDFFAFENNELHLTKPLPESTFDNTNFVSLIIEAQYEEYLLTGQTVVVIEPVNKKNVVNLNFEQPIYIAKYINENTIEHSDIKLTSTEIEATFKIYSDYKDYFKFENNKLTLVKPLPEEEFVDKNFIYVIIEANYKESSGKTIVLIDSPKKKDIPIPVFEQPIYLAKYINENSIEHSDIKLTSTEIEATFKIYSDYKDYFKFENNKLTLVKSLPEEEFVDKNFIYVIIEANYKDSSGKTIVLIDSPKKNDIPIPVFEQPIYLAKYVNENTIEHSDIKLTSTEIEATFKIYSDYKDYFKFENNKLTLVKSLPEEEFVDKNFIYVIIEANYKGSSGKTIVLIDSPKKNDIPIPVFEQPIYLAKYINENSIEHSDIKLTSTEIEATFKIYSDYKDYFKFENNKLTLVKSLPKEEFVDKNFIYVIIEANYKESSGKTIVLIDSPKKNDIPIPVFEQPIYLADYINQNTLNHSDIKLKLENHEATFEIDSDYKDHFDFKNEKLILKKPLLIQEFDNKNFILVTIEAKYEGSLNVGKTIVLIESPSKSGLSSTIKYAQRVMVYDKDPGFIGKIGTFVAKSQINENIIYDIKKSDISTILTYEQNGDLYAKESIPDGNYYQITLHATGEKSGDQDTMDIILFIKNRLNGKSEFEYSLNVESRDEESEPSIIVSVATSHCIEILEEKSKEWFDIDQCNLVLKKIDREDSKLKDMFIPQIKTLIRAVQKTNTKFYNNTRTKRSFYSELPEIDGQQTCIDISTISSAKDVMNVVVIIRDINDHSPKFEEELLVVGYPSEKLSKFIAPPYLTQVKATDEDIGLNSKIKYSVNNNFKIDSELGIIFPADNLFSDTEFVVTATDQDGKGKSSSMKIKVKMLEEKHITMLTLKNIPYTAIDEFVSNISNKTKKTVKYLTTAVLPNAKEFAKTKSSYVYNSDDTITVLIAMYALDDNDAVVTSSEFKKLIESANLEVEVNAEEYELPSDDKNEDEKDSNNVGWIAAVSTLSTLLALVIIGVILAYFFYVRPRVYETNIGYLKHTTRDSIHITPVETKIESSTADRRPTGFPIGFTPSDLDEDDIEENEIKEDIEEIEIKKVDDEIESDDSQNDKERRKSVVKFDVNVTEIEIEEF